VALKFVSNIAPKIASCSRLQLRVVFVVIVMNHPSIAAQ
jgi:hypothetical protein